MVITPRGMNETIPRQHVSEKLELANYIQLSIKTMTTTSPSFYMECVDHMCRLEQRLDSLKNKTPGGPNAQQLGVLKQMLDDIAAFSNSQSGGPPTTDFGTRIKSLTGHAEKLQQLVKSQSWSSFKKILGGDDGKAFELKICYDDFKSEFMKFVVEHFVMCVKKFQVPKAEKQAYLESIDAFTIELDRVW